MGHYTAKKNDYEDKGRQLFSIQSQVAKQPHTL